MNSNDNLEFAVNKENATVLVLKTFAATLPPVWEAFSVPALLDQWWAPRPWVSRTRSMEFKEGGRRLYAMVAPNGEEHWALADFTAISAKTNFKFTDAFCDENGNISKDMPQSAWDLDFSDGGQSTTLAITIKHDKLADLEQLIEMGFKEGFSAALNNLDEIFLSSKNN